VQHNETLHFRCLHCDRAVSVARKHAGKRGKCPGCGQVVAIPGSTLVSSRRSSRSALFHDKREELISLYNRCANSLPAGAQDYFCILRFVMKHLQTLELDGNGRGHLEVSEVTEGKLRLSAEHFPVLDGDEQAPPTGVSRAIQFFMVYGASRDCLCRLVHRVANLGAQDSQQMNARVVAALSQVAPGGNTSRGALLIEMACEYIAGNFIVRFLPNVFGRDEATTQKAEFVFAIRRLAALTGDNEFARRADLYEVLAAIPDPWLDSKKGFDGFERLYGRYRHSRFGYSWQLLNVLKHERPQPPYYEQTRARTILGTAAISADERKQWQELINVVEKQPFEGGRRVDQWPHELHEDFRSLMMLLRSSIRF